MSDKIMKKVKEVYVNGCHVTVERLDFEHRGEAQYSSTVSYDAYNKNGVHIASPTLQKIGSQDEIKSFVIREVDRAQHHTKEKK